MEVLEQTSALSNTRSQVTVVIGLDVCDEADVQLSGDCFWFSCGPVVEYISLGKLLDFREYIHN